jgi:hypothetical protein
VIEKEVECPMEEKQRKKETDKYHEKEAENSCVPQHEKLKIEIQYTRK